MSVEVDAESSTNLRATLGTIWRRKWWIVAALGIAVGFSVFQSGKSTKQYAATATVSAIDPNQTSVFGTSTGGLSYVDPTRFIATQVAQLKGSFVGDGVRKALGPEYRKITGISVGNVDQTNILTVKVTSTSPQIASDAANAYADVFVQLQRDSAAKAFDDRANDLQTYKDQIDQRVNDFNAQIADLTSQIAPLESIVNGNPGASATDRAQLATLTSQRELASQQRTTLATSSQSTQAQIDQLKIEAGVRRNGTAQVIDRAGIPKSSGTESRRTDVAVAAAIGLILGLGLAFGREALGSTIESAEEAERVAGGALPVLGYALRTGKSGKRGRLRTVLRKLLPGRLGHRRERDAVVVTLSEPHSPDSEAYRALRTNIELVRPRGVVLVTSASDQDGKTTTVSNLAASLANAGSSVVAVDMDLRRASVHKFFGLANAVGLTSVLLGRCELADALQPVPDVTGGSLRVLTSGPLPPQPSELIGSAPVGRLVDELRELADYVLIDTPPVLAVSDPAVASRWADDVLVIVNCGWTTQHQLEMALDRLEQAGAPVLGMVLNNMTTPGRRGYYYYGRHPEDRPEIVPPEEWTRIVTRPESSPTNGGGKVQNGSATKGSDKHEAWQRLAGLRASLDDPSERESGDA